MVTFCFQFSQVFVLYVTYKMVQRCFFHRVLTRLRVAMRNGQDVPIVIVHLHGIAGDVASSRLTEYSMTAADVLEAIPGAIKAILEGERHHFEGGVRNIL